MSSSGSSRRSRYTSLLWWVMLWLLMMLMMVGDWWFRRHSISWIVAVAVLFSSQNPLLFHGRFLLQIAVISHVADDFGVGFDAQRFRIVGHLSEFALGFLEIGVILDLRL